MTFLDIVVIIGTVALLGACYVANKKWNEKKVKNKAAFAAAQAAAWLLDYHNPASVNYDPVRVAAEEAAAAAADTGE